MENVAASLLGGSATASSISSMWRASWASKHRGSGSVMVPLTCPRSFLRFFTCIHSL